jgi:hypothetical protein
VGPVGLGTKNHYADEDQQQFTGLDWTGQSVQLRYNKHSAYTERLTRPLVEEEFPFLNTRLGKNESKAIPVTGRGGPQSCETSRLPHFLDNQLADGGEVVSLMRRQPFTPQEDSWYSFLLSFGFLG